MVTEFAYPVLGGVPEHVHNLSRELVAMGHEVTVITGRLGGNALEVDREAERSFGYRTLRLGRSLPMISNGSIARWSFGIGLKAQLTGALRDMDVVHAQALAAPTLPLFACRTSAAPVTVGTFHTYLDEGYRRLYEAWKPYVGAALGRLDRMIGVSMPARETFEELFGGRWTIIPNGVDTAAFRPLRGGERRPPGPPRLLFVGRLEPRNALDTLLDAAAILRQEGREAIVQVVGDGPARRRWQQQARELGLGDSVEWLGARLGDRPRLYREATVFCAPCVLASFGVILLEALASGTPIVCADNVGFRQVLRYGIPGRFVPPRDPAALATALGNLLDQGDLREEWSLRGRALCEERYGWPAVAATIAALYEEVLEENGPGRRPLVRPWYGRRRPAPGGGADRAGVPTGVAGG
jgi:phosphatidyl-myo-inositol alpha-mannosyltransferase